MKLPVVVDDADWVAGGDAATKIGIRARRLRWLIINGHLTPATRADGARGVTRQSVEKEARWRQDASLSKRLRRMIGYVVTWSP